MDLKGGDQFLELLYRIDERVKSMDQRVNEMRADVGDIKKTVDGLSKQVAEDHARLSEIEDSVRTARRVSFTSIAGAIMSLIINNK